MERLFVQINHRVYKLILVGLFHSLLRGRCSGIITQHASCNTQWWWRKGGGAAEILGNREVQAPPHPHYTCEYFYYLPDAKILKKKNPIILFNFEYLKFTTPKITRITSDAQLEILRVYWGKQSNTNAVLEFLSTFNWKLNWTFLLTCTGEKIPHS